MTDRHTDTHTPIPLIGWAEWKTLTTILTTNIGASITWLCCQQPDNNLEKNMTTILTTNIHWCINYIISPLANRDPLPLASYRGKSEYNLNTFESYLRLIAYMYMKYIQIYLISTTKETDLGLIFCFHLKLCLTGKCLQSLLFESIKISPPGKTLPCVNSKLVPHTDEEK